MTDKIKVKPKVLSGSGGGSREVSLSLSPTCGVIILEGAFKWGLIRMLTVNRKRRKNKRRGFSFVSKCVGVGVGVACWIFACTTRVAKWVSVSKTRWSPCRVASVVDLSNNGNWDPIIIHIPSLLSAAHMIENQTIY